MVDTLSEILRRQGVSRRSFLKFCSLTAASMGLGAQMASRIAYASDTKPRIPVIWLHGLECTCCSESFIRSAHPLVKDVVLSMLSLDYDDTVMASAGHQAEEILEQTRRDYKGRYLLAVEGNAPLAEGGIHCMVGGRPFVDQLREMAQDCMGVIAWGTCASWGCVQAARPNPTRATPVHKIVRDKPVIKVPGCPPVAEVMTGVVSYILAFDKLPELDGKGRPKMFYAQRIHDKCYRRAHYDAGQFVESWDDDGARRGYCLYEMGCRGPTTYNACSTVGWNEGVSFPIQSGHGCLGCSEEAFWDNGPFYERLAGLGGLGIDATAESVGTKLLGAVGVGIAAHAGASAVSRLRQRRKAEADQGPPPSDIAPRVIEAAAPPRKAVMNEEPPDEAPPPEAADRPKEDDR